MDESVFSKHYWKQSAGELKRLRMLTLGALLCALGIAISGLYIVVGENLRVYFTFFITAVGCSVYGPVVGMLAAAVTDTMGYIMFPSGAYFPGYMLSEMLGALIYSLFLYRKKITVLRIYGAKLLVNLLVNVALGCLWSKILYGQGYLYYLVKSLIKNTLLLPLEVISLSALFALVIPVFSRFGLMGKQDGADLAQLQVSSSVIPVLGISCCLGGICSGYYWYVAKKTVFLLLGIILMGMGAILLLWRRHKEKK